MNFKYGLSIFLLTIIVQFSFAQMNVYGLVTSKDDGQPLPGVSVLIEGTQKGTTTDFDGRYSIEAKSGDVLVFSFMGMAEKKVTVAGSTTGSVVIDVVMESDTQVLDDVIVTALGISRNQKALGYSVQNVKSDKLTVAGTTNLNTALAGKAAGIQILGTAGSNLGRGPRIRIRGINALNGGQPLYVVDGNPVLDADAINMDDVAEISVLKGASASALYGSRALNGVVLIKTKSGQSKDGKTTVEFTNNFTIEEVPSYIYDDKFQYKYGGGYKQTFDKFVYNDGTHPSSWQKYNGQSLVNYAADESWGPMLNGQMVRHWDSWYPGSEFGKLRAWKDSGSRPSDYFNDELGLSNRMAVAVGKSGEGYQTRLSYTNISNKGVIPNTYRFQNFFALKGKVDLRSGFEAEAVLNYRNSKLTGEMREGYGNPTSGMFNQWYQMQIDLKRLKQYKQKDENGKWIYRTWNITSPHDIKPLYWDSPWRDVNESKGEGKMHDINGFVSLGYKLNDQIDFKGIVRKTIRYVSISTSRAPTRRNRFVDSYYSRQYHNLESNYEFVGNYRDKFFEDNFEVSGFLGGNLRLDEYKSVRGSTSGGLSIPELYNLSASKENPTTSNWIIESEVRSIYGSLSLGYDEMLYTEGTFRSDWSSTLPKNNNNFIYPSVSSSFIFTKLLKDYVGLDISNILSFGKIRASWAQVGGDTNPYRIDANYSLRSNNFSTYTLQDIPNEMPNENLKAQLTTSTEGGVEMKFFNNRVGFDFTMYENVNTNQIISVPVSRSSGYGSMLINAGKITTTGWELSLNVKPIETDNLEWELDFNISKNTPFVNELSKEYDIKKIYLGFRAYALENEEWGTFRGRVPEEKNGKHILTEEGLYKQKNDQVIKGKKALPDYTGGILSTTHYTLPNNLGALSLSLQFDYQIGGNIDDIESEYRNYSGMSKETAGTNDLGNPVRNKIVKKDGTTRGVGGSYKYVKVGDHSPKTGGVRVDGVDKDGKPVSYYVEPSTYYKRRNRLYPYFGLRDATYFKLREVNLSYSLPKSLLEGMGISSASIGFVMRNAWLIYKDPTLSGDPSETAGASGYDYKYSWGIYSQLPNTRSYGFNINVKF